MHPWSYTAHKGGLLIELGEPIGLDFGIKAVPSAVERGRAQPSRLDRIIEKGSDRAGQRAVIGSWDEKAILAGVDQAGEPLDVGGDATEFRDRALGSRSGRCLATTAG